MQSHMKRDGVTKKKVKNVLAIVCLEAVCDMSTHYAFEASGLEMKTMLGLSASKTLSA